MMPPLITVGSSWAVSSRAPIIEVVVVLPWVPAIANDHFSRISSPSISARRTTGSRRRAGGGDFGIVGVHRGGDHDDLGGAEIARVVPDRDRDARDRSGDGHWRHRRGRCLAR